MGEGLADSFDISKTGSPINQAFEGVIGGGGAALVAGRISDPGQRRTALILMALAAVAMKKPVIAAGIAGVLAFDWLSSANSGTAEEDVEFFDPSMLNDDEPLVLDVSGAPLVMGDGSPSPGSEYLPTIYPGYFPPTY